MRMQRAVLVLGGGGMKGLAHIGAWKAVRESSLFDAVGIVGTSIGALVGACVAGGLGWRELAPRGIGLRKQDIVVLNRWVLLLNGIRQPSVFHGERFRSYIESVLPARSFDALDLPLSVNAVDLETGRTEWFGAGGRTDVALADAVYASCALPLFYPPARIGGRYYVDGGVRDSLPITRARSMRPAGDDPGAERDDAAAEHDDAAADRDDAPAADHADGGSAAIDAVIAVDVGAGHVRDPSDTLAKGIVALHHRVYDIMTHARRRRSLERWQAPPPLIYVRPDLDGHSTFDFTRTKSFIEEGYHATRRRLSRYGPPPVSVAAA